MDLIPIACWKLNDAGFAFGSSFVLADSQSDFEALARLSGQFGDAPLSVFGHADPVGDDAGNKTLSGHRATSIYAVLIRDASLWESLYKSAGPSEGWGQPCLEHILTALGYSLSSGFAAAVKNFQQASALTPDGVAGPATRARLFAAYMDFLCPAKWDRSQFLGRGKDAAGKGDYHGCGEFNPYLVFSEQEEESFRQPGNRTRRNAENQVNRRVVIFLFRPGTSITSAKWPCPSVNQGVDACRKRFWSNGSTRRAPQSVRREFGDSQDTFACRFYHRLAVNSPCEGIEPRFIELIIPLEEDLDGDPEQPDHVRLRQLDGPYLAELTAGDPEVVKDRTYPLNFYHFHNVTPGHYAVEVLFHDDWHTVIAGIDVDFQGAVYSGKPFEGSADGSDYGTPDYHVAHDISLEQDPDCGCC